jgi:hypothetical protein
MLILPGNLSGIANEKSGPPAWKQLPTWYQVSENDHAIPPTLEHMFAKQMNAITISLPSSHASLISHPHEIAQLILNAAVLHDSLRVLVYANYTNSKQLASSLD